MNILVLLKKLNYYLGIKIFKTDNLFTYCLYTFLLNFFLKKKIIDPDIQKLFHDGFIQLKKIDQDFVNIINNELSKQITAQINTPLIKYEFTENLKNYLSNFLDNNTNYALNILKKLFKSNVYVTTIQIRRTYYFDKTKFENKSVYSENFHCDKYVGTHYKQFIYLNNVNESNGPFTYLSKSVTKKFISKFKFKNRFSNDIVKSDFKDDENYFMGDAGNSILVNTTQCLHRAGIPHKGKFRDVIVITYVASPVITDPDSMYFAKNFSESFWNSVHDGVFSKKLAKFKSNKQAIKTLFKHINQI